MRRDPQSRNRVVVEPPTARVHVGGTYLARELARGGRIHPAPASKARTKTGRSPSPHRSGEESAGCGTSGVCQGNRSAAASPVPPPRGSSPAPPLLPARSEAQTTTVPPGTRASHRNLRSQVPHDKAILHLFRAPNHPGSPVVRRVYPLSRRQGSGGLRPPTLRDFPEAFEMGRLQIRSPMPGDGPELYAAVRESTGELLP